MLYYHIIVVCSLWHIWADLIQNTVQYCNASLGQSATLDTLLPSSGQNLYCTQTALLNHGLFLAFQRLWNKQKKLKTHVLGLYFLLPDLMCYVLLNSYIISTNFKVFPFKGYQEYAYPCFRPCSSIWVCNFR